ncbi:Uncharacterised protein [Streptococcus criceti]|uniref:Lipoprotein n=1 Tax=Streptococcus criceti HS-6 TaxID=873449 RepID=G5JRM6_STRCG|nr:hypothetical protein [Streptococcus criceti]EHI73336.1 putative lipoprotein [Streptococcus criceti HS-6]SUN42882.1 Uncharacterised protein [Streptococcus criceti]
MTLKKIIKFLVAVSVSIFLVSCSLTETNNQGGSEALTVTNVHDHVVRGRTTEEELVKLFGEPRKKIHDSSKVEELYDNYKDQEGGMFDLLDDNTNYYKTEKYVKVDYSDDSFYDSCYIYHSNDLGLEFVRFYIKDDLVRYYHFGDITDKSIAKKDKYLRQIIE